MDLRLDLTPGGTAGDYDGLDRFGRVKDMLWYDYDSSPADAVRIKHGYNYASSRTWREDAVAAGQSPAVHLDELYDYDGLQQLTDLDRGNLNSNKDGIVNGTLNFAEEWGLEPIGNWVAFKQDTDGDEDWDLDQTREHNRANELTKIPGVVSGTLYDAAGKLVELEVVDSISDDTKARKVSAWEAERNTAVAKVDWHFTTADARVKLKRLYRSIQLR